MGRSLAIITTVCCLAASSTALAVDHVTVRGDPTKRWIQGDELGFYYEIPMGKELVLDVVGPGTLIMFLVNHEAPGTRGNSILVVTKNKKAWKRLKLGCVSTSKQFTEGTGVKPCKRMTRDLQIATGSHRLGLRLKRTKVGASVHFLFASQAELDVEPELVTSMGGGGSDELSWEEAGDLDLVPISSVEETGPASAGGLDAAWSNPWMWALTGMAVATAGTGVFFGMQSSSNFSDAGKTSTTQRQWKQLNDDGEQNALLANIMFGVAGASLAGAALLYYLDANGAPQPAVATEAGEGQTWILAPRVGQDAWGVDAWLRF